MEEQCMDRFRHMIRREEVCTRAPMRLQLLLRVESQVFRRNQQCLKGKTQMKGSL